MAWETGGNKICGLWGEAAAEVVGASGRLAGSLGGRRVDGAISALPVPWKCQQELELQIWSSCHCCCEVSCTPGAALSNGAPEGVGGVSRVEAPTPLGDGFELHMHCPRLP